ncbi:phenylacetic acid degradation protein [Roseovarius atlanticus]|uniref:Phenylacetic acid degradation protein n=1 Tax=Roseovarius atlanticus TaxID=1641875 RepID=A0A0T5NPH0_9RHOB|nr:PaaI family thioesterase [Roseovarius atlanticus]KRS10786.1 phenylacetic acid degradation protein [Roseovarius atlanticus]
MSAQIENRIRDSFARQSMMQTLGATLADIAKGKVEITAPILDGSRQQQGVAHAGLTFAIGDSAAGYSALTLIPEGMEVMTTEMKINLLAPGAGDHLVARGRVIKPGRRLMVVQSDIFAVTDGAERHIAMMVGTMIPVDL